MTEVSNEERAERAYRLCLIYGQRTGLDVSADGMETVIGDLIADLLHLADEYAVDTGEVLRRGHWHYQSEVTESTPSPRAHARG